MPTKLRASHRPSPATPKHPDTNFGNAKPHDGAKGKKRTDPPPRSQCNHKRHSWGDKAVNQQQHLLQPRWSLKPRTTTEVVPSNETCGATLYRKKEVGNRKAPNRQPNDPLLEDDSNMLGLFPRVAVPDSAYNLRQYDDYITAMHQRLPKYQAYRHGNGKLNPYNYGSSAVQDLGLCFVTFCTTNRCEMGVKCAWRHHPLTKAEREWILFSGNANARLFLEGLAKFWAVPEVPVPGASMHDK
ncbi:hypothetical protein DE146DRAFT_465474 [Phaeosphaeria sp. MPI-PUGE-AT-0046c]|nr:hypothetical protein DE146DRAFT_465474 [Phaeosphaeria sp. MPI-PUGE-AT-0046c]